MSSWRCSGCDRPACRSSRYSGRDDQQRQGLPSRCAVGTIESGKAFSLNVAMSGGGVHTTCIDPRCAARQHHQPVEAERDTARLRHLGDTRPENPRPADSLRRSVAPFPSIARHETIALFPSGRSTRRTRRRVRPRRHRPRTARQRADPIPPSCAPAPPPETDIRTDRQTPLPQIRLDMLDQDLTENIRPGVVLRHPAPCLPAAAANAARSPSPSAIVASRSIPANRSNAPATVRSSGSTKGSAVRPRNENPDPGRLRGGAITTTVSVIMAS